MQGLKRDCKCKDYHNPDKLLVHCVNNVCGKWLHEECLLEDAKERAWARLTNSKASDEANSDTIEVNGNDEAGETIQVAPRTKAKGPRKSQAAVNGSSRAASGKGSLRGRNKAKKGDAEVHPWTGLLEAKLERKPVAEGEDESSEITGKVLITDLRDDKEQTWKEPLTCLFCRKPL